MYEFLVRFEDDPTKEVKKLGVCLQDDAICKGWDTVMFARTHSFKDAKYPTMCEWDVFVSPSDSRSTYGIKIICNQLYPIKKSKVLRILYQLQPVKVVEMDRRLWWAVGLEPR